VNSVISLVLTLVTGVTAWSSIVSVKEAGSTTEAPTSVARNVNESKRGLIDDRKIRSSPPTVPKYSISSICLQRPWGVIRDIANVR